MAFLSWPTSLPFTILPGSQLVLALGSIELEVTALPTVTHPLPGSAKIVCGQSYKHFTSVNYEPRVLIGTIF